MTPETDLHGRRIFVLGGDTELGRTLVIGLAEAGADVAIASLSADAKGEFAINSALNELWAMGRQGLTLVIDAGDEDQVRQAVARATGELGPLDVAAVVAAGDDIVAVDALRDALAGRRLVVIPPEAAAA